MQAFNDKKIIVCVGSGGVGKTTVSAALGCLAAEKGLKVLVITIDPAKRLAQALGLNQDSHTDVKVPLEGIKGELYAGLVRADIAFEEFIRESLADPAEIEKLLNNSLYKQLSTNLSGSQEFTSLDRLYRAYKSNKYDLIILDTPPAQHAVDFLSAPEKIYTLFQKSITKWFAQDPNERGFLPKLISKGTVTVLSLLEKVTGSEFISELANFFSSVQGIQDDVSSRSMDVQSMLMSEATDFYLVTGFDEIKLTEAKQIFSDLKRRGLSLSTVIVNKCFPIWLETEQEEVLKAMPEVHKLYLKLSSFYQQRKRSYDSFSQEIPKEVRFLRILDLNNDINGLEGLVKLSQILDNELRG